jgi:hypothetical protein
VKKNDTVRHDAVLASGAGSGRFGGDNFVLIPRLENEILCLIGIGR